MTLYYATTNQGKVKTLQRELEKYHVTIEQFADEIPEPRSSDVQEIAAVKVAWAYRKLNRPVVALDAGFYIYALNGFPKAYVNFALETIGLEGILKLVAGKDRKCEFRECLAYLDNHLSEPLCFLGHVKGTLAEEPRGTVQPHHWSRLSLIFIPENGGRTKTLGETTYEEHLEWRKNLREETSSAMQFATWYKNNTTITCATLPPK
ncbi:non-canonical purine NTP pyrophosphatase [Anaerolineales bacterium HSG24]|nr:non-canonical purine NTP pyrophosphatase [Anaerolineales bacterium HSG24]